MIQGQSESLYAGFMSAVSRDLTQGFLPPEDPLTRLPDVFEDWEQIGDELSKLALSRHIRPVIQKLPPFPIDQLETLREHERAMTLLSFIANMYCPISIKNFTHS